MLGFDLRWFPGHSAKPRHQTPHQHACAFPIAVLQYSSSCCCRYVEYCCYPATVLYQLQPSGDIKWPLPYCAGDWWHRPYASVLLEMERVVVRRCNKLLQRQTNKRLPVFLVIRSVCYIALIAVTKSCAELQNCCAAQFTKLRGRAA